MSQYCCPAMERLRKNNWQLASLDFNTNTLQLIGAWDWEDWDDQPFRMICCMFCGEKLK